MKEDIYNYCINESVKDELLEKSQVNAKLSQTYSDMPKGNGGTNDGVSNEVFRRLLLKDRIEKLEAKMLYIDRAEETLDEIERQVIQYLKRGYKMTRIAILLGCSRRNVVYIRDKAIEKIMIHANRHRKVKSCSNKYFVC